MIVSICIASLGRPSLRHTIDTVRASIARSGRAVEILVADDSADGAAATLLADMPDVIVIPVAAANVSLARNACLDHARGDWLLFVDDDEYVDEAWLDAHLRMAAEHGADVVLGPVYHLYPEGTPDWFRAVDPLFQDWGWSRNGQRIGHGRTGNTLVRRDVVERLQLRFDPRFGRSGGEDHDFFSRLVSAGGVMVVTDRAKAWETVPAERCNAAYILDRAVRGGQTHALITLDRAGAPRTLAFLAGALAKLAIAATGTLLAAPLGRATRFRLQIKAATNYGKLLGAFGGRLRSGWQGNRTLTAPN